MKIRNRIVAVLAAVLMLLLTGCEKPVPSVNGTDTDTAAALSEQYPNAHILEMDVDKACLDGKALAEFDYTWRVDPSLSEVQFTGTKPDETFAAYIAHDIIYYPEIPESEFTKENYDGEQEWITKFTAEGLEDYIFGTLPVLGSEIPTEMMHSADEAYGNPVIHITQPGEYILEGSFNGQLFFDFGDEDETFADPDASVTVILNGAKVVCSVAPAIVFHDVYECDNTWESRESYSDVTDLTDAGVKIILTDGTENSFTGCNVYRLLKPEYKKDSTTVQKKLWKTDGAFYSFQSLAINGGEKGTGILNITGKTFEGLDCELHMTINGGYVNIFSQDDGINVNEDGVSVFTLNDGHLTVFASLGAEGDVIDSNGYIRINGGVLAGTSKSPSDELLDSENGTYISETAALISGGSTSTEKQFGVPGEMPFGKPDGEQGTMPFGNPDSKQGLMPPEKPTNEQDEMPPTKPDSEPIKTT